MKKILVFLPILLFSDSLLNSLKQQQLNINKKETVEESKDTSKSWINPIMLQYSYSKDNTLDNIKTTNKTYSISINQPIFKSGAIYYSIKYANHLKTYNLLTIKQQKRTLIKQALDFVYDYKITKLNQKIIELNIQNAKIDIQKKKEDFLNGVGDSTLLNNAVLKLNSLKLNLEDVKTNLVNIKNNFSNISSLNIEKVKLPKLKLISEDKYINSNIDFIAQKNLKKIKYDLYKMQLGNQLLSVNLQASYNWQNINYSKNTPQFQDKKNNFYRIGFSVMLPISFNATNKIEKTKLDFLKSQVLINDKKISLKNSYKNIINQLNAIDKKIKIYKENIKIYNDLIASTKDSIKSGNATLLDLEILQNSKQTNFYNIEILKLKQQKLLLSLYYQLESFEYGR